MTSTLTDGAFKLAAGLYLTFSGIFQIAKVTYNVTAPVVVFAGSAAYSVTATHIAPAVASAGIAAVTAVTRLVKGKPSALANTEYVFTHTEVPRDPMECSYYDGQTFNGQTFDEIADVFHTSRGEHSVDFAELTDALTPSS
jgi:hypothetical protein